MKVQDFLTKEEIQSLTERSDLKAAWLIFCNWFLIAAGFAIPFLWPSIFTLLLSILILGGRQLGLSVIVHDCGHRALFKSAKLNEFAGNWFGGYAIFLDMDKYAKGHLIHHRTAGTHDDPDLPNYENYPISRDSFYRKIWRDLSGQTAIKLVSAISKSQSDSRSRSAEQVKDEPSKPNHTLRNSFIVNGLMILALTLFAHPALYLLWVAAYFTVYMLVLRIRQIAEHADVPDLYDGDPRNNTRTTYTNPLTRLLIAPNFVNYHLEHHLLASVPAYNLKRFHYMMKNKGAYNDTPIANGYWEVIQQVTQKPQATAS
ncbi:MAG: fatty acid desaturase family protein [Pseudomonadales bacterium]|nr:fatty acid desaturase family protein [Pseudomonadales bacterium]